jgi:tetratricopeptide (TPR) repeat protein
MIASVLAASGRTDEAHARYDEAIALLERDDRTGSNTMARAINNRAGLYRASGDYAGAADAYRNAWAIYRENLGRAHPFAVIVQGNVGSMLLMQDSLDTAEPLLRDALAGLEQSYGADHRTVGNVLADVGLLELRTGRTTEAASALQRAVTILAADLPAGHPSIAVAELRLGQALSTLGRTTEAEPLLLSALATFTRVRAQRARDYDDALTALEELYDKLGRAAEARRFRDLRTDAS